MLHADRNIGLRQRHPKGWTVNNDLIGQETHSRRESFFGLLSQIGVEVKAINDDAAEFLANVHREGKTRLIELPSLKTIDQMNDAGCAANRCVSTSCNVSSFRERSSSISNPS